MKRLRIKSDGVYVIEERHPPTAFYTEHRGEPLPVTCRYLMLGREVRRSYADDDVTLEFHEGAGGRFCTGCRADGYHELLTASEAVALLRAGQWARMYYLHPTENVRV